MFVIVELIFKNLILNFFKTFNFSFYKILIFYARNSRQTFEIVFKFNNREHFISLAPFFINFWHEIKFFHIVIVDSECHEKKARACDYESWKLLYK